MGASVTYWTSGATGDLRVHKIDQVYVSGRRPFEDLAPNAETQEHDFVNEWVVYRDGVYTGRAPRSHGPRDLASGYLREREAYEALAASVDQQLDTLEQMRARLWEARQHAAAWLEQDNQLQYERG